ncbi:hypothetical protein GUA46_13855 [Muricauda sp. HICW]|uniref:Uncharacterized protein n=1 Tax=Flagellimonas chongwuensis TaxID=2697365 RepID=A0A850NK20_9FLAO|nr:hypothetical protein [Allomuricauda chongwuensis]NVN19430.1 hypothetical protein [Allomuricauda chongwuensis]
MPTSYWHILYWHFHIHSSLIEASVLVVKIDNIAEWLAAKTTEINRLVEITSCFKWRRWNSDKSMHVFPCVCPQRENPCASIELYHRVWSVERMLNNEQTCIEAILDHDEVKKGKVTAEHWLKLYSTLFEDVVVLQETFSVTQTKYPERTIEVILPKDEIRHLIYFKELYIDAMQ